LQRAGAVRAAEGALGAQLYVPGRELVAHQPAEDGALEQGVAAEPVVAVHAARHLVGVWVGAGVIG